MLFERLNNTKKDELMRDGYRKWKMEALDESGYFIIFQGFLQTDKLKDISGNALKLYIYLGMNANNLDGRVWHSNEKIAAYFNKSERTIRLWMKELENIGLIKRMRLKYNGNVFTYLLPYKYKADCKKNSKVVEGYLYIDNLNSLYIKTYDLTIPITNNMEIEVFDPESDDWIIGRIEIRREVPDFLDGKFNESTKYIFRSKDRRLIFDIEKNQLLKIRSSI